LTCGLNGKWDVIIYLLFWSHIILTVLINYIFRLISQLPSDSGVYTFPTNYLTRVVYNADPDGLVSEIDQYQVNILKSKILLLPFECRGKRALLVLYNPITALECDMDVNTFMVLFDSNTTTCIDPDHLSRRVRSWLNRILDTSTEYTNSFRFDASNYPLYIPEGKNFETSNLLCLAAIFGY